jgi:mRNA interferase MazF
MFKKGEIYLARLNPRKGNEVGKVRPVLIYQNNFLNEIEHPTTSILPLSTQIIDDAYPLRYKIFKRDNLLQDSDILCDQIRTIDNQRISNERLTILTLKEMLEVDKQVKIVLDIEM